MAPRNEDDVVEEGGSSPDSPTNLEIADWDATTVKLKWKAPENDGGAPVTFYYVEYKTRTDEEWTTGLKVKSDKKLGTVEGLTTGTKYEFRVLAENRAGKSGPSEATLPQMVKTQKAPPRICRKSMEEKILKTNQQLDLAIPVEGEPAPELKWTFKGQELKTGGNAKVGYASNMAKLLLIPVNRSNEGKYTLSAKNQHGEDTLDCDVKIFGKPTVCRDLKISEVSKKGCRLEWKAPEDNGGSVITQYEVEKLDDASGNWLPAGQPKGPSIDLKNLVENHNYMFLVRAVNKDGDSPDLISEDYITAKNPFDVPTKPGKPKVENWGPTWAEVSWKAPEDDGGAAIQEYRLEMRDIDKRSWVDVATLKDLSVTVDKAGIEEGREYVFRVTASNKGGESEASDSSEIIEAMNRFVKPRLDKEMLGKEKDMMAKNMLRMEVACIEAQPPAKISWFLPDGEQLLQDNDRIMIDNETKNRSVLTYKNIDRSQCGQWSVVAKNSVGEDNHEVRMNVISAPSRPSGAVEVYKVTPSSCTVLWKRPKDDGGSPITGYVVEKKDVEKDYWSPCGKVTGKMANVMKELECDVTDLVENFVYVFRVIATNALGDSPPLMGQVPIIAKFELDPPNQPYNINVVDFDKKWVKLEWVVAPGPRCNKFIVEKTESFLIPKDEEEPEKKEEGEEEEAPQPAGVIMKKAREQEYVEYSTGWMVAGETEDDSPEIKIQDLQEGYRYQFRVKAYNKAGASYPSETSEEIVAKVRKQKPVIERVNMPEKTSLIKGDNLTMKVKVEGEPITNKIWYWGRREIKSSSSVNIDNSDYGSRITILHVERADTGTFAFRAENDHGAAEVTLDVVVQVPPNKPKGPMHIDDITAEGCKTAWSPPEDDGGSPVTHYVVEKVQGGGENWVQCGRVAAPQTDCKIGGLTEGKEYRLQVRAVNNQGESEGLVCVDSFITENPFQCPGAPGKPELKDWDSDHFDMKWAEPKNDGGSRILGYELEARLWRDPAWFKAGEVRMQMEHGLVEGVELGQGYSVRVRAKNAAGHGHWSLESDQVVCKHRALQPKVKIQGPRELTAKEGDTLVVQADVPAEPACEDIKWFIGERELVDDIKSGVTVDNRKEHKSTLQIDVLTRKENGILSCQGSNIHGVGKATIPLVIYGKPGPAEDRLQVSKITASSCKLTWQPTKQTGGLPVEYLVEKYIVAADSWIRQGVTPNYEFLVNDLEANKEYEFRVFAFNEIGESDPLSTSRPILAKNQWTVSLPPDQPVVTEWNERCMTISWEDPMDDGGMPVTGYTIEARMGGGPWQIWETLDTKENKAIMQKLNKGQEYQFRVFAVNKAGKSEPSHPSRPKVAKETDLVPYIDAKTLRDTTAEAKERVKFDVAFSGEPEPEAEWFKCDGDSAKSVEALGDSSISVMNTTNHSKIVFNSIAKKHAGIYSIVVKNKSGEDSAKVVVKVLDRPAAPEGPMGTTVEGGNITLLWKKCKDDGGCAIEHYQLEKKDNDKETWAACGHTTENTITLPGLMGGLTYQFRVCAVNRIGDSDPLTSEKITIDEDALTRGL